MMVAALPDPECGRPAPRPDKALLYLLRGIAVGELTPDEAVPLVKQALKQPTYHANAPDLKRV